MGKDLGLNRGALAPVAVYDNVPKFARNSTIIASIEKAPPILHLEAEEIWCDEDDSLYPIEIRGERSVNGIYFKAKDVSKVFGMENLLDIITKSTSPYKNREDYYFFIITKSNRIRNSKNRNIKQLFMTYFGLVKMLFISRNQKTKQFQQWAINILFTHQFGNKEEKEELGGKLLSVNPEIIKSFLSTSVIPISCVYLFKIGLVKDLRLKYNIEREIPGYVNLVKFGFTKNLKERTDAHKRTYGEQIELLYFSYIDPKYTSQAELFIKQLFKKYIFKHEKFKELVLITPDAINGCVKSKYIDCSHYYGGILADIKEMDTRKSHQIDLWKTKSESKDELIKALKNELAMKDKIIKLLETN
jgi:hypothetical protein